MVKRSLTEDGDNVAVSGELVGVRILEEEGRRRLQQAVQEWGLEQSYNLG